MKKQLLFVINNLNCGGAEKALISLLQTIDYERYDVDLFLFKHEGMFLKQLPKEVVLLNEPPLYRVFDMSLKGALIQSLKKNKPLLAISRIQAGAIFKTETNRARCEQRVWKYVSKSLHKLEKQYDAAIGYLEKNPIYFIVEKVSARIKLGFIHNDYDKLGMDSSLDTSYFDKLDKIVSVSEECVDVLKRRFPQYSHKVELMYNIVSPKTIRELSREYDPSLGSEIAIVSVGRLNVQKGFELAVEACRKVRDAGHSVTWHIIGEGEERGRLERLIDQHDLRDYFFLHGLKENPYPYLSHADIYVQPSRFEGKSVAIDEAKILAKPIIVTNFSTASNQITHGHSGMIVEMNAEALSAGIQHLIDDEASRQRLSQQLANEELGTESEIEKLYRLI